jgi:hypothetical protein
MLPPPAIMMRRTALSMRRSSRNDRADVFACGEAEHLVAGSITVLPSGMMGGIAPEDRRDARIDAAAGVRASP